VVVGLKSQSEINKIRHYLDNQNCLKAPRKHIPFDFLRERRPEEEESKDPLIGEKNADAEEQKSPKSSFYKLSDRRLEKKRSNGSLQKVYFDEKKESKEP
jgi:hypothetical protein